jgi:hypothetical protein
MKANVQNGYTTTVVLKFALLFFSAALSPPHAGAEDVVTVRGRVEREVRPKNFPVPYIKVTLKLDDPQDRGKAQFTDAEGMYYFRNTRPGRYVLEVWGGPKRDHSVFRRPFVVQPIRAGQRYFDLPPVVLP